jgi:hypothetical protein
VNKDLGGSNLLSPGYPPIRVPGVTSWSEKFMSRMSSSSEIKIVTGYASESSLHEFRALIESSDTDLPKLKVVEFFLGMAFFEGLTERQKKALWKLNETLLSSKMGRVYIPTEISVHTKATLFCNQGSYSLTLGSSNFSALLPVRRSELDVFIESDQETIARAKDYFELLEKASLPLDTSLLKAISTIKSANPRLQSAKGVEVYDQLELAEVKLGIKFELPIKTTLKSNMNKYLAKPRGKIPRNWYEVEIIVPSEMGRLEGFPSAKTGDRAFTVYTHDGHKFKCHVSGGNAPHLNKNFESSDDLKVLGYWLKGLLVDSGALDEGDPVTNQTLSSYGRSHLTMQKIESMNSSWLIDFGRP